MDKESSSSEFDRRRTVKATRKVESAANEASGDDVLDLKIKEYSRNKLFIRILLMLFAVTTVGYLTYVFLQSRDLSYKELSAEGYALTRTASSDDGKKVLLATFRDSLYYLFVSEDSGVHFQKLGTLDRFGDPKLYIAPGNETIVITKDSNVFYCTSGMSEIKPLKFNDSVGTFMINGIHFSRSDPLMYIYGESPYIVAVTLSGMNQVYHEVQGVQEIRSFTSGNGTFRGIGYEDSDGGSFMLKGTSPGNMSSELLYRPSYSDSSNNNIYNQKAYTK